MPISKTDNKIQPLISTALTLTDTYQDLYNSVAGGPLINGMDCESLALWIKLDINLSTDFYIKMLSAQSATASDFYHSPIKDVTASVINIQPAEYKFSNNADQNIVLTFPMSDQLPFVKFQVKVGTVGGTPGQVLAAGVTFTSNIVGG